MEYNSGEVCWTDLTVPDAQAVRDFYSKVMGWTTMAISMGEYDDYVMMQGDKAVGGVCHARGSNSGMPAQWIQYVAVDDVQACIAACNEAGGKVVHGPRMVDKREFAVIEDPAGAVMGVISRNQKQG